MIYAADIGHSYFKGIGNGKRVFFPSVLGEIRAQLVGQDGYLQIETDDGAWFIGDGAIEQSLNLIRGQDKSWLKTPMYRALLLAGISEVVSPATYEVTIDLVSGLPVADFSMRDEVSALLSGSHLVRRPGRRNLEITIRNILFVPQALAAFDGNLNDGKTLVVLDIGGRNINYSTLTGKRAIATQCGSTEAGMLNIVEQIARQIKNKTGRDLKTHQAIEAMKTGRTRAYGQECDVSDIVTAELEMFVDSVHTLVSSKWGDTSAVDILLIAGGGALMVGERVARRYPQARIVDDPQWANANGYLRYGRLKFGTQ